MKVNMDDLLLAGLLDNDDELILLSQVCSGSDVPSFEKGFRPRHLHGRAIQSKF